MLTIMSSKGIILKFSVNIIINLSTRLWFDQNDYNHNSRMLYTVQVLKSQAVASLSKREFS